MTIYDSRSPAPGVRVSSVPRPTMHGLTMTQTKAMRTVTFDHSVLQAKPLCQPVKTGGGGLPPSMVTAKGDTRSTNHRRRSPKMRVQNHCFQGRIPSRLQTLTQEAQQACDRLRELYKKLVRRPGRDLAYECLRKSFWKHHRDFFWMVRQMEDQVQGANRAA